MLITTSRHGGQQVGLRTDNIQHTSVNCVCSAVLFLFNHINFSKSMQTQFDAQEVLTPEAILKDTKIGLDQFFDIQDFIHIEAQLWEWLIIAMSSPELDAWTGLRRVQLLVLYASIRDLIFDLDIEHQKMISME